MNWLNVHSIPVLSTEILGIFDLCSEYNTNTSLTGFNLKFNANNAIELQSLKDHIYAISHILSDNLSHQSSHKLKLNALFKMDAFAQSNVQDIFIGIDETTYRIFIKINYIHY